MTNNDIICPYADTECPKLEECKKDHMPLSRKVDILIFLVILFHGAEILTLIGGA